jgi:hypothetical protein
LGNFLGLEPNWANKQDDIWDWILVEMDVCEGLVGNIDIMFENYTWHQRVDYWNIPFRCHGCREIGHILYQCPNIFPTIYPSFKKWRTKKTSGRKAYPRVELADRKISVVAINPGSVVEISATLGELAQLSS